MKDDACLAWRAGLESSMSQRGLAATSFDFSGFESVDVSLTQPEAKLYKKTAHGRTERDRRTILVRQPALKAGCLNQSDPAQVQPFS